MDGKWLLMCLERLLVLTGNTKGYLVHLRAHKNSSLSATGFEIQQPSRLLISIDLVSLLFCRVSPVLSLLKQPTI